MAQKSIEISCNAEECELFVMTSRGTFCIIKYEDVVSDISKIKLERKLLFRSENDHVHKAKLIFISRKSENKIRPEINDVYVEENNNVKLNDDKMTVDDENDVEMENTQTLKRKPKSEVKQDDEFNRFGPNKSLIKKSIYNTINWHCYKIVTRELLMAMFTKETLGTHVLVKTSFENTKNLEKQLDVRIIEDIVHLVCEKFERVRSSSVRAVISSKCAEENKIFKKLMQQHKNGIKKSRSKQ